MFQQSVQPYNPDYDAMPPYLVSYGQPSYHIRLICTMRELGLTEAAAKFQEEWEMLMASGGVYDTRGVVAEYTHPEDPRKPMLYRLKTDQEIEVDAITVAPRYMSASSNRWIVLSKYVQEATLDRIYRFGHEIQQREMRRLFMFGLNRQRW